MPPSQPARPEVTPWQLEVGRLPTWLRRPLGNAREIADVQQIIKQRQIHTICEEGRCPNRGECYAQKTATFCC
ncbi:hypothetical protein [Neosynechococcus sphagnicola]|uniref:hypothetical protein n=1 Tax=Neosynechococcus sphagnicola TaxID=1501145 RepID=UPI000AF17219